MGCMKLYGSFHITPEPKQGLRPIDHYCSGPCSCLGPGSAYDAVTLPDTKTDTETETD